MANVIESILSKNAEEQLRKLYDGLDKSQQKIIELSRTQLDFNGGGAIKTFSDFNNEMEKSIKIRKKTDDSIERTRLAEIRLQREREKNIDRYNQGLEKEARSLLKAESAYNRIQASVNLMSATYRDLAIRKELGNTLSAKEERQLDRLLIRINQYESALRKVNFSVQKTGQNVGNYPQRMESSFNGLSNSVNQIFRETPAAAVSLNTFFLGISNNLPILFDEIERTKNGIKALKAEGKSAPSLFSQLSSSVFSFQTLLSVGVTLLTLYGGTIIKWIGNLKSADSALQQITESQLRYNDASAEGNKEQSKDLGNIVLLASAVRNEALSRDQRNIAYDKLMKLYPAYFKEADRENTLNGNTVKSQYELIEALNKRNQAEAKIKSNNKVQERIIDIETEIQAREKYIKSIQSEEANLARLRKVTGVGNVEETQREIKAKLELIKTNEELRQDRRDQNEDSGLDKGTVALEKELNQLLSENKTERREIIKLYGESLLLDKEDKKEKKSKEKIQKDEIDYLAKVYELRKKNNEILIAEGQRNMNNEELNYEQRYQAMEDYYFQMQDSAKLAFDEENRLNDLAFKEEKKRYEFSVSQGTATLQSLNQLEYKYQLEREIIKTNFEDKNNQVTIEKAKALKGVLGSILDQNRSNLVSERSITDLRQVALYLQGIGSNTTIEGFKKLDKQLKSIGESEKLRNLDLLNIELQRNLADQELLKNSGAKLEENEAYGKLKAKELELVKSIQKTENESLEETAKKLRDKAQAMADYLKSFTQGFFGENGFPTLFKALNKEIKGFGEDFATTFVTIAEIAQETINFLNQNQQAYFDNQYARLEREKDIAILYAGESTTAKAEIERQYEDRKREVRIKEAKATRELAIFNAVVNTAQAVVAALPNIALSVLAGVIGAAQIALIASQPLPEFWKGTMNAPEGWAVVDEKRPEVHTDSKGNIKSTGSAKGANRRYLEKGDKIYKSHEFYLDKLLSENGISMHSEMAKSQLSNFVFNGNNSDIASEIKALRSDMRNNKSDGGYKSASITKSGAKEFFEELFENSQSFNDRVNFKIKKY